MRFVPKLCLSCADLSQRKLQEMTARTRLEGARILIVEDEALIAALEADMLRELGCVPLGPAHSVDAALAIIESEEVIDGATLDVRLDTEISGRVASALMSRNISFVVCSAYTITLYAGRNIPIVGKPYVKEQLKQGIEKALGLAPSGQGCAPLL